MFFSEFFIFFKKIFYRALEIGCFCSYVAMLNQLAMDDIIIEAAPDFFS